MLIYEALMFIHCTPVHTSYMCILIYETCMGSFSLVQMCESLTFHMYFIRSVVVYGCLLTSIQTCKITTGSGAPIYILWFVSGLRTSYQANHSCPRIEIISLILTNGRDCWAYFKSEEPTHAYYGASDRLK